MGMKSNHNRILRQDFLLEINRGGKCCSQKEKKEKGTRKKEQGKRNKEKGIRKRNKEKGVDVTEQTEECLK